MLYLLLRSTWLAISLPLPLPVIGAMNNNIFLIGLFFHLLIVIPCLAGNISSDNQYSDLHKIKSLPIGAVSTDKIGIMFDQEKRQASFLANLTTRTNWLEKPCPLYELQGVGQFISEMNVTPLSDGKLKFELTITNTDSKSVAVTPNFPVLRNLSPGGSPQELGYCFPQRNAVIGNVVINLRQPYSSHFPLQFMNIYHPIAGSITLMTQDLSNSQKTFWLHKKEDGCIDLGVEHRKII